MRNLWNFAKLLIRYARFDLLEEVLADGWVRGMAGWDKLRQYAADCNVPPEIHAMITEHQRASGARPPRAPSLNPSSYANLSKLWAFEVLKDNTIEITRYKGVEGATRAVVPSRIGRRTVTRISANAFTWRTSQYGRLSNGAFLSEITIPGTIEHIPDGFCSFHEHVTRVTLQEGVRSIGESAFNRCPMLRNVSLPETLESTGKYAFSATPYGRTQMEMDAAQ